MHYLSFHEPEVQAQLSCNLCSGSHKATTVSAGLPSFWVLFQAHVVGGGIQCLAAVELRCPCSCYLWAGCHSQLQEGADSSSHNMADHFFRARKRGHSSHISLHSAQKWHIFVCVLQKQVSHRSAHTQGIGSHRSVTHLRVTLWSISQTMYIIFPSKSSSSQTPESRQDRTKHLSMVIFSHQLCFIKYIHRQTHRHTHHAFSAKCLMNVV